MKLSKIVSLAAFGFTMTALSGCSGVNSSLRYGADGQPEHFIECTGVPMSRCYSRALSSCPQGYFLVNESQIPTGAKSGSVWGRYKAVGGQAGSQETTWKNQLVVRCKPGAEPAPAAP